MDRLDSLREELRQMEEARTLGNLNQSETEYLERLREEITRLENQAQEDREKADQEKEEQEIERLFNENEWVQSHLAERQEMEAAQARGELSPQEQEDLQRLIAEFDRVRQQIIEQRNKAIEDDIRRRQEERDREIEALYNADEWVREHLAQQSEMERDLAQIENDFVQRQVMVQRNGNLPDAELDNLASRKNALRADLDKLKNELNQRRKSIEANYGRDLLSELQEDYIKKKPLIYHFVDDDGQEADITLGDNDVNYKKAYKQQLAKLKGEENNKEEDLEVLTIEDNNYKEMTDEELQALLDEFRAEYAYRVHQENGLIEHDDDLITRMNEVEAEIKRRKKSKQTGPDYSLMTDEELQALLDEFRAEYTYRVHQENGLIEHDDDLEKKLKSVENEVNRRKKAKESKEAPTSPEPTSTPNPEPEPTPNPEPEPEPTPISEPHQRNRTLEEILNHLMSGEEVLGLSNRNYSTIQKSNIKIARGLKASVFGDGPLGYIIVKVPQLPAHVTTAITLLGKKISGHLLSTETSKNKIASIRKKLDELPVEDLMTIYREYRGNKVIEAKLPDFLNDMILERIERYVKYEEGTKNEESIKTSGKTIEQLRAENNELFRKIYAKEDAINEIDKQKLRGEISSEEAEAKIAEIAQGTIELVTAYRQNYDEINRKYVGDSGLLGFKMGINAAKTGMNLPGRIAAKKNEVITSELQSAWSETSEFEGALADAIAKGDELDTLNSFVGYHNALSRHTLHKKTSLWGDKSVGIREYSPNPSELDYREDPFFKDLTRSVMSVTAIATAADAIMKESARRQMVADHNRDIKAHNADVDSAIGQVQQSGKQISDQAEVFGRGAAANAHQGQLAVTNAHERQTLDHGAAETQGDWIDAIKSSDYSSMDAHNHMRDTASFTDMSSQFAKAQSDLASGAISGQEYLRQIRTIANSEQIRATAEYESCLETMVRYAQSPSGSDFDLTAAQGGLQYMIDNSDDIINMNNAMGKVIDIGAALQQIPPVYAQELGKLPSNLVSSLVASGVLAKATAKLSEKLATFTKSQPEDKQIHDVVEESVRQEDKAELIRDAELRYYNLPKFSQVMARIKWRKIQQLKEQEELSAEDVETIKGAFK